MPEATALRCHRPRRATGSSRALAILAVGSALAAGWACGPADGGSAAPAPLVTEEVGGAIDAELSTGEDPRGPRWVELGSVLPAGFPVDLPLAAGAKVAATGSTGDGASFVVFEAPASPDKLAIDWQMLLEDDGWQVSRPSATRLTASKSERTVTGTISAFGSGSRLRVVYR